jgi:chromosome segregation ATPase
MNTELIIGILASSGFTAFMTYLFSRKKTSAEAGKINIESYTTLLDAMRDASERMEKSLSITQESFRDSMTRIRELLTENTALMVEMGQMKADLNSKNIDIELLRSVNSHLKEKMLQLNEINEKLRKEIEANEATIKRLNTQIAALSIDIKNFENRHL